MRKEGEIWQSEDVYKRQVQGIEIFLPLKGLIDMDKEIARLEKEEMCIRDRFGIVKTAAK